MVVSTKAIVISTIKYSEADLIVSCYTEKAGIKTYLLRNILKSKKGNLKASYFQPLTQLELIANHKDKGALEYIKEAKIIHPYQTLHTEIPKTGIVLFLSEILKNCIKEEEANNSLYLFLENSIKWLDSHCEIGNFHIAFLLHLSRHLGFYPDSSSAKLTYFNSLEGFFQASSTNAYCAKGTTVEAFKIFLNMPYDNLVKIKLKKKVRLNVLDLVLDYYKMHVEGFRMPKSLAVLNELFQ